MIRSSGVSNGFVLCYEREMRIRVLCGAFNFRPCLLPPSNRKISGNTKDPNYVVATSGQAHLTSRKLSSHMAAAQFSALVALALVFLMIPHAPGTYAHLHCAHLLLAQSN
jgi:hypothetical protein